MMRSAVLLPPSWDPSALTMTASGIRAVRALADCATARSNPTTFWNRLSTRRTNSGRSQNVSVRRTCSRSRCRHLAGAGVSVGGCGSVVVGGIRAGEAIEEQPVAQTAVAHGQRVAPEQAQHGANDAGAGQDHLGAVGLQPDDLPSLVGGSRPVELDLAIDLADVEHGALYDVGVVRGQRVLDRREV